MISRHTLALTLFCLANLFLSSWLGFVFMSGWRQTPEAGGPEIASERKEYPMFLPLSEAAPTAVSLTVEDSVHLSLYGEFANDIWTSTTPIGGGYVHFGENLHLFAVPMFHQLHCIEKLQEALAGPNHDDEHPQHCLNYLRQFILCNPDLTLEPGDFMDDDFSQRDRVGVTHTCRNWDAVYEAVHMNWDEWVAATGQLGWSGT